MRGRLFMLHYSQITIICWNELCFIALHFDFKNSMYLKLFEWNIDADGHR